MSFDNFRVVTINGNTHVGEEISSCVHSGFLWVHAVPKLTVAGTSTTPNPQHLIFSSHLMAVEEVTKAYEAWCASQGS